MKTALFLLPLLSATMAGQTVEGVVVDSVTGAPLTGAYISMSGASPLVTRTDAAGHFLLAGETTSMQVARAGYVDLMNYTPRKGESVAIQLVPESVVSGIIEDEDGFPVSDAQVTLERYLEIDGQRSLMPLAVGRSNDLGEYRIGGLKAGKYYLYVSFGSAANWDRRYVGQFRGGTLDPKDENLLEVKAGALRAGVDIHLAKFEGVTVSGRVEGFSKSSLAVGPRLPHLQTAERLFRSFMAASVESDGSFVIRHVVPGQYKLEVQDGLTLPARPGDLYAQLPVEVGATDLSGLVLPLHEVKPVDVAGNLLMEGGGKPSPMVILVRGSTGYTRASSEEDGSFVLKGLLPGHYDIQAAPDFARLAASGNAAMGTILPLTARLGENEVLRKGFDVDSQPVGPLLITQGKPIQIKGTVIDAAGRPVAGVWLYFRSDQGIGVGTSNAQGTFQASLRGAGNYRVYVLSDSSLSRDSDYLEAHQQDFPPVTVSAGSNPPLLLRWMAK